MLYPLIAKHLSHDDDPALWEVAVRRFLTKVEALAADGRQTLLVQIGCCHHWISPHHPLRWKADGGFAWPFGYDKSSRLSYRALPELTWSELLCWNGRSWGPGRVGKRGLVFRIAIPARTARHLQAAIHTVWLPHAPATREKLVTLYGFRKKKGKWSLTATQIVPPRNRRGLTRTMRFGAIGQAARST